MALLSSINTREDLDSLENTPAHAEFMTLLTGSLWSFVKNDDEQRWDVIENNDLIEKFGFTRADFGDIKVPAAPEYVPPPPPDLKMEGVEFEGVMCSATREDQNGLLAVLTAFQLQGKDFKPTKFYFANGATLELTKTNVQPFMAVWLPFRQGFFKP